jgi:EAL domain-containing protein (putative c-di-GMP-specific phosphodiesterase class I)
MGAHAYLEGFVGAANASRRFALTDFPCLIGRHPECGLQLNIEHISRHHAQIDTYNSCQLVVTDLHSTNGTYVNRKRINRPTPISDGDVLHFANHEFRLIEEHEEEVLRADQTAIGIGSLPQHFPTQAKEFKEMLHKGLLRGFYQAIMDHQGNPYAYELLGRGAHPALGSSPGEMFALARALDAEVELSESLRRKSLEAAAATGLTVPLFFNTHPKECRNPERLLDGLRHLRELYPHLRLVCEVHEAAVTALKTMAEVRDGLRELGIGLAYDDFGAGQARLLELVEIPPDFLKFDISLIAGVTGPASPKYRLVMALNTLIQDMGIKTIAEGIETEEIAAACASIGIDYSQGYLYSEPSPIPSPSPVHRRGGGRLRELLRCGVPSRLSMPSAVNGCASRPKDRPNSGRSMP